MRLLQTLLSRALFHGSLSDTEALSKNQDVSGLLPKLGLTVGYAVGVDVLPADWDK